MRYNELTETTRNLGGFNVKVVASVPGGAKQDELDEASNDSPVAGAITRRIMSQRPDLLKHGPQAVMAAIDDVADWVGDVDEIGSSDVSGWVKQVERMLNENPPEAFGVGVNENTGPVTHRIGLTVTDPNHPMVSKRKETYQKTVRVTGPDREKAINSAIAHARRKGYKVHDHHYIGTVDAESMTEGIAEGATGAKPGWMLKQDPALAKKVKDSKRGHEELKKWAGKPVPKDSKQVDEAIKLDAPQKSWSKQDMQDYLTRVKTGTKTKQDRFKPIIHGSNVKAITKDDGGTEWDLDELARQITTRPRAILGSNAKMSKSKAEGAITYDLTLPALSGIVVDEETGEFVEIVTCPGAGECQLYCYARKGGYVMFPASSMSAAQALNFLVNHPEDYMKMFDSEVKKTKGQADKHGIRLLVRIHDAGDFFSKDYYNLMMDVARNNQDVKFYFYTKMGELATDSSAPPNVVSQFSPGAKSREVKTVQMTRDAGRHVKDAVTLPKDMFRELFVTDAKGKYIKDEKGRTQVKSEADWNQFKQKLADVYKLDPDTIITYDQMNRIPEGPKPKWNVVIFPAGHGDLGASRLDVSKQFLMFH